MNIQSSNSVTKTANESPLSSAAQGSVTAAMVCFVSFSVLI